MNYKQKYEEAIERCKSWIRGEHPECFTEAQKAGEFIFPELRESEDERIRKAIIEHFEGSHSCMFPYKGFTKEQILAWFEKQGEQNKQHLYDIIIALWNLLDKIDTFSDLQIDDTNPDNPFRKIEDITQERHKFVKSDGYNLFIENFMITNDKNFEKQDEQKSTDKVEPKFKVGDYMISNNNSEIIYHITGTGINELGNPDYVCEHVGREKEYNGKIYNMSQDKVDANFRLWTIQDAKDGDILCSNQIIVLFKQWEDNTDYNFVIAHAGIDVSSKLQITNEHWLISNESKPATKEQCDLLFQKMKEVGYEWNAEEKELKKIEKESTWSEEDEKFFKTALWHISYSVSNGKSTDEHCATTDWLKSLKDRVQPQPKQEWSEEDKNRFNNLIHLIENSNEGKGTKEGFIKFINRIKSLKPQNKWKPSEEQLRAILNSAQGLYQCKEKEVLLDLYEQLKNL